MKNTIKSAVIGTLVQDEEFESFWQSEPVGIPLFDNKLIEVVFTDYELGDNIFLQETEEALKNFWQLDSNHRNSISKEVYKNCMDFLNAVDYDEADDCLWQIKNPREIWEYVYPIEILVSRRHSRDKDIYITVACECEWEREHGLQLVFRQGKKLTRISDQDGHVTEADAYDKPDSQDKLLSQFSKTENQKPGILNKIMSIFRNK